MDAKMSRVCNQVNNTHCARWHRAWMCA